MSGREGSISVDFTKRAFLACSVTNRDVPDQQMVTHAWIRPSKTGTLGWIHGSGKACIESQAQDETSTLGSYCRQLVQRLERGREDADLGLGDRTTRDNVLPSDTGGYLEENLLQAVLQCKSVATWEIPYPFLKMQIWGTWLRSQ